MISQDFLVIQWLRIRLLIWGTQVPSPVPEDPACYAGPKPVIQTAESEPACCRYWCLRSLEPVLRKEKRPRNEPQALQGEQPPPVTRRESLCAATKTQCISEGKGREVKVGRSCSTLCNPMDIQSMEFSAPEYRSEGPNPGLPHYRQSLYQLSHKGSPRILELVPFPFSSESSRSRNGPGSPALQVDSLVQKWTNIFKKLICLFIFYYYFFSFPNFFSIKVGFIAVVPGLSPGVASVCGLLILEPLLLRTGSRPAGSRWCRMQAQFCDCRALQSRLSSCAQA